ncbi:hypothetical protein [Streptomyces olivaceus]|uniref:hypothetical protein n=1 Tax=Streptomyces olivaceus TaxID=47716 RepID=UPI001CCA2905|nr:hypothetical protein [Streptomyces olivaceus]MBZ6131048.1 hypothetical protein [Streptomyces olivaceus]MBZ6248103.1 hypothetical protein [Streptomyces olivaceus]
MEQRRGSTSQPLEGAGFDPAFIPGLTAPVSGEPEDVRRDEAEKDAEEPSTADDTPAEDAAEAEVAVPAVEADAEEADEADDEAPVDGPVFEASDRRAKIVADHKGVRLSLDDQACEFRWDEVGAVETETGRFGKRFTVTVHTPDRRWYPIEIEAASRSRFAEWESALDEVLDAYFEDGETEPETESESEPDAKSDDAETDAADAKDADEKADEKDGKADGKDDEKAGKKTDEDATARAE